MGKVRACLKNAMILTITGFLLRAAGMLLRVYMADQVGAEGMGLYQLIFTVYSLCSTFATAGISVAATRIATEEIARNSDSCLTGAMRHVIRLGAELGFFAAFVQLVTSYPVAKFWLGDIRAVTALRLLAPSLPFMSVSAALKGYFFARRNVGPGVKSQLFEQLVRMGLIFWLVPKVAGRPIGIACAAVVIGNTVSEVLSCLLIIWYYSRDLKGMPRTQAPQNIRKRLWNIAAPVEGGRCLDSGFHTAENVLVPACLMAFLKDRKKSLAEFGALKGMTMPLLLFPYSFLNPISTLLLPEITEAHMLGNRKRLENLVGRIMLFTNVFSVLAAGLLTIHAKEIAQILYHNEMVAMYLMILSPMIPAMYLDSMGDAVLKGLGEEMATFRYSLWDSVLRIGLTLALSPRYGMPGFLAVMLISNFISALLNILRIHKVTDIPILWGKWFIQPILLFVAAVLLSDKLLMHWMPANVILHVVGNCLMISLLYGLFLLPLGLGKEIWMFKKQAHSMQNQQ